MHPAIPIAGGAILLTGIALRIRAIMKTPAPAAFSDPAQRPPPSPDATERDKQQVELVKQALSQEPPPRQFKTGEIIGVDVFPAGLEISTMNDVRNPRPGGIVTGIVNMKVIDTRDPFDPPQVPEDKAKIGKFVQATFADERFFIEPLKNSDGSLFPILVPKITIANFPDPAGGLSGNQGFMDPAKEAVANAALQGQINPLSQPEGIQGQINPIKSAIVTTNDPAPAGDLVMRTGPGDTFPQVPGGGAEKSGTVTVLNENASSDGVWAEVQWDGGSRRPPARGFAKRKFLKIQ